MATRGNPYSPPSVTFDEHHGQRGLFSHKIRHSVGMYLIVIAWMYVATMMAVVEAASPQGSLLGAAVTWLLYGLLPTALLVYILGTPARKRRLHAQRQAEQAAWHAQQNAASTPPVPNAAPAAQPTNASRPH